MKEGKKAEQLEQTKCARMYYPGTKGILCNRTRACKLRAHTSPRDKKNIM